MKNFFLLIAVWLCSHSPVTALDTNEWFKQVYIGNPSPEVVSNRICYAAEKWCHRELERNPIIRKGHNRKDMQTFCEKVLEDIRLRRFSTDDSYTAPINWGGVVHISQMWYAIPQTERDALEEKWNPRPKRLEEN